MPIVKCNVSNCSFWGEGNNCQADSILVEVDDHANNDVQGVGGMVTNSALHEDVAQAPAETCCHTFKAKY
jgi:hypothetical protein